MKPLLAQLRARFAGRPDTEHEQALVRLLITLFLVLYLLPDTSGPGRDLVLYIGGTHFVLSVLVLLRILYSPDKSPTRRVVAMVGDFSTVTCYMVFFGEHA